MEYNFTEVEKKWQEFWAKNKTFRVENQSDKPKYYVLDMFPYPSGAGLHVGHPLGYIASDIFSRFKRHKGFNVLHPMGYDSFGLPAEQYAIQTGQHPEITTKTNIARYREQLDKMGFSFDWDREVRTSNADYYKWTQWIFIQLFNTWFNKKANKAEKIETLIHIFEKHGFKGASDDVLTGDIEIYHDGFTSQEWKDFSEATKEEILQEFRLAYLSDTMVNWCPQLGTVLANEEVKEGVSERGGYPVERKLMRQWSLRITAYADRLLKDLEGIDWTESIKEAQRNWIGKSEGTSLEFRIQNSEFRIEVFTTRPDTIFGVSFLTLAPEHELVSEITTADQKKVVDEYVTYATNRSERDRMSDVKKITGVFTGAYAEHPFNRNKIPVWIGDYVLAGYGTGAVMAVPAHDSRDFAFANYFNLEKPIVIQPNVDWDFEHNSYDGKEGKLVNSDFLNGLEIKVAVKKTIEEIEKKNIGKGKTNYRLRDAIFGRQRYWGEPIPVYYKDGIPQVLDESELPLLLPEVDKYLPTETGEPPLARAKDWKYKGEFEYEYSTMPGWAGSSWYYLRYMDAHNEKEFASKEALNYWKDVDLYIGGSEHSTGHLLYVRFWTKFLYDMGLIPVIEPAKKLINQGMIQGVSAFHIYVDELFQIQAKPENFSEICMSFPNRPMIFISRKWYNQIMMGDMEVLEKLKLFKNELYHRHNPENSNLKLGIDYDFLIDYSKKEEWFYKRPVPVEYVLSDDSLPIELFEKVRKPFAAAGETRDFFVEEDGKYYCLREVEKMSKSKWNVVTPDIIVEHHGADALRLYEMFLGPLELSKPWSTNGITGVSNFLRKLWRLYHTKEHTFLVRDEPATKPELKVLHKTIKKITEDIERFSFNTSVSNFMICVNELTDLKCNKREVLEPLAILISPYAPHIAEELWEKLGHTESIAYAKFPECNGEYLIENSFSYPISVNGKTKFNREFALSLSKEELEKEVLNLEQTKKILEGKSPKMVIVVPGKIVNIVI